MENVKSELVNLIRIVSNGDDAIDSYLEPIKDYTDTLGDTLGPIRLFKTLVTLTSRIKFEKFLKGLASSFNEGEINENDFTNLERFLSKEINQVYISDTIHNAVFSKSINCSMVLGCYAGKILKGLEDITYKDTVILNSLSIVNDLDIENFLKLYEFYSKAFSEDPQLSIRTYDDKDVGTTLGVNTFELENTIEKLKSVQVIGYDAGGIGYVGNAWGSFQFNDNTHYFYDLLVKSSIRITI